MKAPDKQFYLTVAILAGGCVIAGLLYAFSPEVERDNHAFRTPVVNVLQVMEKTLSIPVYTRGTVQPRTDISLFAEVAGRVVEVSSSFENGGFFSKGENLLKIDRQEYELAIHQSRAQVASAEQQLEAEKARAQQAIEDMKRAGKEINRASAYAKHEPQLEEARARLKSAQAVLSIAHLNLKKTGIKAPFDGRIRGKKVDVGEYVIAGKSVADVYSIDYAEIRLPLTDRQLSLIDSSWLYKIEDGVVKTKVTLSTGFAGKEYSWNGQIVRSEGEINSQDRLIYLVARVEKPYAQNVANSGRPPLAIGLFVEAVISGKEMKNIIDLPRSGLRGGDTVWVVNSDSRLEMREVSVVYKGYDRVYIESGLLNGDKVITSSLEVVSAGMRVDVYEVDTENIDDAIESKRLGMTGAAK